MGAHSTIRSFVAIDVGEAVRAAIAKAQDEMRKVQARVSWVSPDSIHLTLVFLGDLTENQIARLAVGLERLREEVSEFECSVKGTGFFGSRTAPRIIWAGLSVPEALSILQQGVAREAQGVGVPRERRPYKPHLTLGRVRGKEQIDELRHSVALAGNVDFGTVKADCFKLMKSDLSPSGARYTVLREFYLKGTGNHGHEI